MHSSFKRRVKIVCTLGPASSTEAQIIKLIEAGMDVARLNFSHGTHDFHAGLIQAVRSASKKTGKPVAILQDLQGPKIRAGLLPKEGVELIEEAIIVLHPEGQPPKHFKDYSMSLPISAEIAAPISKDVRVGAKILFDDGKLSTECIEVKSPEILVKVLVGGRLTSNKGMNLPGTPLSIPCLTEKDLEDLQFGLKQDVDAVALSFVRSADDIEQVREIVRKLDSPPLIFAKIEREEAITNQGSIIESADGILIARGDMAVEIGAERVPTVQKNLIQGCRAVGVPVITATQMLESMISSAVPTRAEANDVANAVWDQTDAVMLSGETAGGKYPRESVETMARIILESEISRELYWNKQEIVPVPGSVVESVEFSASRIAQHVGAVCIACLTHSGLAAKVLSKFRPDTPVVALTQSDKVLRQLCFYWGIRGAYIQELVGTDDIFGVVESVLISQHWAETEDHIVVTAGIPTMRKGTTNMVKVHRVGSAMERATRRRT